MKVQESYLYKDQHYLFIQKYPTKSAFVLNLLLHIKPFFYLTMHFALFWKIISPHLFLLSLFSFEFVKQLLCLKLKFKHHSINHLLRSRDLMRHFPCTIFWPFYCLVFAQTNLYRIRTEDHPIIFFILLSTLLPYFRRGFIFLTRQETLFNIIFIIVIIISTLLFRLGLFSFWLVWLFFGWTLWCRFLCWTLGFFVFRFRFWGCASL